MTTRKLFLVVLLFVSSQVIVAQKYTKIKVNHNHLEFTITSLDTVHTIGDTVFIDFRIKNCSSFRFFLYDIDSLPHEAFISSRRKELSFSYGGHDFDPSLGYGIPKLRILKQNEELNYHLKILTSELPPLEYPTDTYQLYVSTGYIPYSDQLRYLTDSGSKFNHFKNENDWNLALNSHRDVYLGNLLILVTKR